ncbi:unnamed protein product [Ilex paraguariensis]|uniref:Uncharacterized protein n=1 Tax=Ilex paraguariensis TaxID=185542 RepID=A0ABC8UQQ2_9AQUA
MKQENPVYRDSLGFVYGNVLPPLHHNPGVGPILKVVSGTCVQEHTLLFTMMYHSKQTVGNSG